MTVEFRLWKIHLNLQPHLQKVAVGPSYLKGPLPGYECGKEVTQWRLEDGAFFPHTSQSPRFQKGAPSGSPGCSDCPQCTLVRISVSFHTHSLPMKPQVRMEVAFLHKGLGFMLQAEIGRSWKSSALWPEVCWSHCLPVSVANHLAEMSRVKPSHLTVPLSMHQTKGNLSFVAEQE